MTKIRGGSANRSNADHCSEAATSAGDATVSTVMYTVRPHAIAGALACICCVLDGSPSTDAFAFPTCAHIGSQHL